MMCDGSLQKDTRTVILHTQSFSLFVLKYSILKQQEHFVLAREINEKFQLHCFVLKYSNCFKIFYCLFKNRIF